MSSENNNTSSSKPDASASASALDPNRDGRFMERLQGGLKTAQAWDRPEHVATMQKIRQELPWTELCNPQSSSSKYAEYPKDDWLVASVVSSELQFVQHLARYFQRDVMTWVNAPTCGATTDPSSMQLVTTRGPETEEERLGEASRVEVWKCPITHETTTFPRYSNVSKLYETKQGRCGEYANLFGLYCRAVGLETRYVLDWTDHVWVEVCIHHHHHHHHDDNNNNNGEGCWYMVDSCEGVIHEPSMYEAGWGKQLTWMVAFGTHHVQDVTPRYTRQFMTDALQQRRRAITTSELAAEQMIFQLNQTLVAATNTTTSTGFVLTKEAMPSPKVLQQLPKRVAHERRQLEALKQLTSWNNKKDGLNNAHVYQHGRISGSTAWKVARHEAGRGREEQKGEEGGEQAKDEKSDVDKNNNNSNGSNNGNHSVVVPEAFLLPAGAPERMTMIQSITVHPQTTTTTRNRRRATICLNRFTPCAQIPTTEYLRSQQSESSSSFLSVAVFVVLNDVVALWHSRVFVQLDDLNDYLTTLPSHVIVAMSGQLPLPEDEVEDDNNNNKKQRLNGLKRLGGFDPLLLHHAVATEDEGNQPGEAENKKEGDEKENKTLSSSSSSSLLLYLGQVDAKPSWTVCARAQDYPHGYTVETTTDIKAKDSNGGGGGSNDDDNTVTPVLAQYPNVRPQCIVGRLQDDEIMDLATQQDTNTSLAQKQAAFITFWRCRKEQQQAIVGFATRPGLPIYLLGETAYPFHDASSDGDESSSSKSEKEQQDQGWTTCLWLPKALIPPKHRVDEEALMKLVEAQKQEQEAAAAKAQAAKQADAAANNSPAPYQIPVDTSFFESHLGPSLVLPNNPHNKLPTSMVLDNCRLVGLYFSASWCGPCRSFTPVLSEAYEVWKDEVAQPNQHGMQIVLVSSDRDGASFARYHASMPWPAMAFDDLARYKPQLSAMYGVRGIPSLVILDAVSGQVVVNASASRQQVMQAAQRGGDAGLVRLLRDWLQQHVPPSTLELLQMLQASCLDHSASAAAETTAAEAQKTKDEEMDNDEAKKEEVDDDSSPYLKEPITWGADEQPPLDPLPAGPHDSLFQASLTSANQDGADEDYVKHCWQRMVTAGHGSLKQQQQQQKERVAAFLQTLLKYVTNCRSSPWTVKYRHFRVSNKVVDRDMSSLCHALTYLQVAYNLNVSFVAPSGPTADDADFVVSLPVVLHDWDALCQRITADLDRL